MKSYALFVLALSLMLLAVLIVSGCGGGGGVTPPPPPPTGSIAFTSIPAVGVDGKVSGQVTGAVAGTYYVILYTQVADGGWSGDFSVGVDDAGSFVSADTAWSTVIAFRAFIIPTNYTPPVLNDQPLSSELSKYASTGVVPRPSP